MNNNYVELNATIYFTYDGERLRKENLGDYLIKKAEKGQEDLAIQQKKLSDEQAELKDRIDNYS